MDTNISALSIVYRYIYQIVLVFWKLLTLIFLNNGNLPYELYINTFFLRTSLIIFGSFSAKNVMLFNFSLFIGIQPHYAT